MIKIHKIKNWYGIKELKNAELIEGNTIIYSPNGVMKTSFSDGIRDLILETNPKDIFNDLESEYEIENNGILISELSNLKSIDAIVFSGDDYDHDIYDDSRIAKLVISTQLKKEYENEIKKSDSTIKRIHDIISKDIAKDTRYTKSTVDIIIDSPKTNEIDQLIDFIDSIGEETIKEDISKLKYTDIFSDKFQVLIDDTEFVSKCKVYNDIVNKKFDELIFNNEFTFDNLKTINEQLKKLHFFDANHSINLNDIKYNSPSLDEYIEEVTKDIYGTEEVKQAYDDAKKIFDKKANVKLTNAINEYKLLLPMLKNPKDLKQKIINTNAIPFLEEFKQIKSELLEIKEKIGKIIEKARSQNTIWDDVLKVYNERFVNKNFEITINNSTDAVLDLKIPVFEKKLKENGKIITTEIQNRFSSGEKRAIFILSLLYEIKIAEIEQKNFVLILDDVVDSFDYKNKYSMIQYLKELSENGQIQLLIFTQNFDFYRSCRIALGSNLVSKLIAYRTTSGVDIIDARNKEFENFSFIKNWRSQKKIKSMIALLPFLRNVIEIKDGINDLDYIQLCHFLHFDNQTPNIYLNTLDSVFNNYNVEKANTYSNRTYFETLCDEVSVIVNNPLDESRLLEKIVLGIFIRVATDKLLVNRFCESIGGTPNIIDKNWTIGLYRLVSAHMTNDEFSLYNKAITIAPAFLHVNGFMYEPLIDVGFETITQVVTDLKNYLNI